MKGYTRRITEEIYNNAITKGNGYIADEDREKVFSDAELYGYGIYIPRVYKTEDGFFVNYEEGSSCD